MNGTAPYPARLDVDYSPVLDRVSTALRFIYVIPIAIILGLVVQGFDGWGPAEDRGGGDTILEALFVATALMLVVRLRYPRWWFDFLLALHRFSARVAAYALLLTDRYPSTEDEQAVHLELDYPETWRLNRWLPLVKWILAIPHYLVLGVLSVGVVLATAVAWFVVIFTGRYPRELFDFVVGVGRWALRVQAYAFLLLTDEYPPFSLRADPRPAGARRGE